MYLAARIMYIKMAVPSVCISHKVLVKCIEEGSGLGIESYSVENLSCAVRNVNHWRNRYKLISVHQFQVNKNSLLSVSHLILLKQHFFIFTEQRSIYCGTNVATGSVTGKKILKLKNILIKGISC